jgi:hypothetical protein
LVGAGSEHAGDGVSGRRIVLAETNAKGIGSVIRANHRDHDTACLQLAHLPQQAGAEVFKSDEWGVDLVDSIGRPSAAGVRRVELLLHDLDLRLMPASDEEYERAAVPI